MLQIDVSAIGTNRIQITSETIHSLLLAERTEAQEDIWLIQDVFGTGTAQDRYLTSILKNKGKLVCDGSCFTHMLAKTGLRKHGETAEKALMKEFMQLMDMNVMDPQRADELTAKQKREALGMINMIKEKRGHTPEDQDLIGCACTDGRPQKPKYTKEETASQSVSMDAFMIQLMLNAIDCRDIAFSHVAGAYLHVHMTEFVMFRIYMGGAFRQHLSTIR